ncbi:hypothetical protein CASFOL_038853 [Castilleja foliolosa]|uniref:Uncharacterized protein n=1 Tax=Castilleja foliolosa TaxID=1961234 RepID=A0ABD3BIN6_9LAMI
MFTKEAYSTPIPFLHVLANMPPKKKVDMVKLIKACQDFGRGIGGFYTSDCAFLLTHVRTLASTPFFATIDI